MSVRAHKSRDNDLALTVHDIIDMIDVIPAIGWTLGQRLDSIPLYKKIRFEDLPPGIHGYDSAVFQQDFHMTQNEALNQPACCLRGLF
jgi:hypothetical protein